MKKNLICIFLFIIIGIVSVSAKSNEVGILIDHEPISLEDASGYIDCNENVLLPIRFICEHMGYDVSWNGETNAIRISNSDTDILLYVGGESCIYNGETKKISVPVVNNNGTTYLEYYELISMLDDSYMAQYWDDETEYEDIKSENGFVSIYQGNELTASADGVVDWRGNILSEDDLRDMGYPDWIIESYMADIEKLQSENG